MTDGASTLDLAELVERLRRLKFEPDTRQYLDAHRLLLEFARSGRRLEDDTDALISHLAPVFCRSPLELQLFAEEVRAWRYPSQTPPADNERPPVARHRNPWHLAALATVAFATLYSISGDTSHWHFTHATTLPVSSPAAAQKKDSPTQTPANTPPAIAASSKSRAADQATHFGRLTQPSPQAPAALQTPARDPGTASAWFLFSSAVAAAGLLSFCGLSLLDRWRRRLIIKRMSGPASAAEVRLSTTGPTITEIPQQVLRTLAAGLQRARQQPVLEFSASASVTRTVNSGGIFSLSFVPRLSIPEYLVLIDCRGPDDHAAHLTRRWFEQLREEGVALDIYEFNEDPRVCTPHGAARAYRLTSILARHHRANVLLCADSDICIDFMAHRPHSWFGSLSALSNCALLTLKPPQRWGDCEGLLISCGAVLLPATTVGFQYASEMDGDWSQPVGLEESYAREFPPLLSHTGHRWLDRSPPLDPVIDRLLQELYEFLGPEGYNWLCACAIYPRLTWPTTTALLPLLRRKNEEFEVRQAIDEWLPALARLPWFRHGQMPDWLRRRLIAHLTAEREAALREMLGEWVIASLIGPVTPTSSRHTSVVQLLKSTPKGSPLHDEVFMGFMAGASQDPLTLGLPYAHHPSAPRRRDAIERLLGAWRALEMRQPTLAHLAASVLAAILAGAALLPATHNGRKLQSLVSPAISAQSQPSASSEISLQQRETQATGPSSLITTQPQTTAFPGISAQNLETQATMLAKQGHYQEALDLEAKALSIYEKTLGPETPQFAASLNLLAQLYHATGAYAKAEPLYQRALSIDDKNLGPAHPDTAFVLNNLAELYQATGAYVKAEPLYERALAVREKALGPMNAEVATTLNDLAELYYETGAYAKAEPLYQRALDIDEKALGPESPQTATALNNLADLYRETGAYAKAEPLFRRAIAIDEKTLGAEHRATATALYKLGKLYYETGDYAKAEPLYQRALAIDEKALGPENPDTAASLNNLAELYQATVAYSKAEPLYRRALAIREKVLGPDHPDTASSLDNLASLYFAGGAYTKSEPLYQRALAIDEKAFGPEHPNTAAVLDNLAELYRATGAYGKAEALYQRALAIDEKAIGPEHPNTAAVLDSLAELYRLTGAYAKAEPLYQRALAIREKIFGPESPRTASSINSIARLYYDTGAYVKAEALYRRALSSDEKTLGPNHPDIASALNNLADLYNATGAYAKAEPLYQRALSIDEKTLGPEHPDTAASMSNLAELYAAMGDYSKAEPLLLSALTIREKSLGPDHPETARSLQNLGMFYSADGAYAKAEPLLLRAQDIEERNTQQFLLSVSEARQQAYLRIHGANTFMDASFSLAVPASLTQTAANAAGLGLTSVLRYKGRALDSMAGSGATARVIRDPQDLALFDQLSSTAQQASSLIYDPPPQMPYDLIRERLTALAQKQEQLESLLSSRSATFRQAVTPITVDNVRQRLPPETILLEWFRYQPFNIQRGFSQRGFSGDARYVVFLLKRTGDPVAVDLGPANPIEDLVTELRHALGDPKSTNYGDVAKDLYQKLFQPLRSYLTQGERLLISPDSILSLIPFAALVDENSNYLAQHYEISYLTSGRDLLRFANEPRPRSGPVVIADPNYDETTDARNTLAPQPASGANLVRSGLRFTPLPGTATEAAALRSLLKLDAQSVLTGNRATKTALRALHGPRILHLATSAFFLSGQELSVLPMYSGINLAGMPSVEENPLLLSGLALAGANVRNSGTTDDGILTAAEFAELDLAGTQLAVLSACETGLGAVTTGEGVYGFRRALVLAGAQAQLVSLWKLADSATQELVVDYYERLLKGEGRAAALRSVQRQMMINPARKHPYYWASFILSGDWTPLPPDTQHLEKPAG